MGSGGGGARRYTSSALRTMFLGRGLPRSGKQKIDHDRYVKKARHDFGLMMVLLKQGKVIKAAIIEELYERNVDNASRIRYRHNSLQGEYRNATISSGSVQPRRNRSEQPK